MNNIIKGVYFLQLKSLTNLKSSFYFDARAFGFIRKYEKTNTCMKNYQNTKNHLKK
jgi:hypothetical protein